MRGVAASCTKKQQETHTAFPVSFSVFTAGEKNGMHFAANM